MKKIIIASTNPVKINAARDAFIAMFPHNLFDFHGINAASGVAEQPMSSDETRRGAKNRVQHARQSSPDADYWIAFEGGLYRDAEKLRSVIWVAVENRDGYTSEAQCASFLLPPAIANLVNSGMTLGDADDKIFGRTNSKQQNGAIGLLTHDILTRQSIYADGAVFALIPYKNPDLFKTEISEAA
jgi:inosine/xanthosine triphosphatase